MLRKVTIEDASALAEIYNFYIDNTIVTFEETRISTNEMVKRINEFDHHFPWNIYELNGEVLGYAYASKWKSRCAYRYAVESTIYLKSDAMNKGIGTILYKNLIEQLSDMNIHAVIGGISLPNPGSIAIHEKMGYKKVAHFKEVGYKFGKWIDVGYWELIFNTN